MQLRTKKGEDIVTNTFNRFNKTKYLDKIKKSRFRSAKSRKEAEV